MICLKNYDQHTNDHPINNSKLYYILKWPQLQLHQAVNVKTARAGQLV